MAYVKPEEVRKMNADDRVKTLTDLRKELQHERGVAAMGGSPPSPGKIRQIRRQIARILTIQNEERLGIRGQTEKKASARPRQEPTPIPGKGQPAQAARKAHEYRMAKEARESAATSARDVNGPAPKEAKAKSTERAPKRSEAKKPAAPEKAAANKAAKSAAGSKPKKEETRRNG